MRGSVLPTLVAAMCVPVAAQAGAPLTRENGHHQRSRSSERPVELRHRVAGSHGRHSASGHHAPRNSRPAGHHAVHVHRRYRYYQPYFGGAYRYPYPYAYPAYPYGDYPYPHYRYSFGPIYVPAERLYGPGAVRRFMGVDQGRGEGAANSRGAARPNRLNPPRGGDNPGGAGPAGNGGDEPALGARANRGNANLAWRLIGFGDAQFAAGDFLEANVRYRKAVAAAPRLGAPYFRQGYALMASGRWHLAAESIRRGLKRDPDWSGSGFTNAELYAEQPDLKTKHMQRLAEAAEADQDDVDRLLLMGVLLHFDGKPDRARPFFERIVQLSPGDTPAARAFLK